MKILYTSSYEINGNHPKAVSISGEVPEGFTGKTYRKLAPKRYFYDKYIEDGDIDAYSKEFYEKVLTNLDPYKVLNDLEDQSIMLCYEPFGEFCHRHLVAEWLEASGLARVTELVKPHYSARPNCFICENADMRNVTVGRYCTDEAPPFMAIECRKCNLRGTYDNINQRIEVILVDVTKNPIEFWVDGSAVITKCDNFSVRDDHNKTHEYPSKCINCATLNNCFSILKNSEDGCTQYKHLEWYPK